ncbi:MAG: cytochrome c biogenesis protein CcdA, partial [Planctomycetota bacterium]
FHAYGTKEPTNLPVKFEKAKWKLDGVELDGDAAIPPGEEAEAFGIKTFPLPHEFRVTQKLRVKQDRPAGKATIEGEFFYQVCDENGCELPKTVPFAIDLPIEAGAARAAPAEAAPVDDDPATGSLWALILACIGGGLFALVMPCTYPMIPITFSFFTKQADARGGKVLSLALAYGFGIVAMFAAIGALASALGGYIVPFAAHWITNAVIGTAFVVFGLSLIGVITLQPPRFLTEAAGKSRSVGGLVGVLLMGATLVISSFTCTAPVVALLLVPAVQSGEGFRPMLGMAAFGATMALPFVLLALLPSRVKKLPRSGEWMNTLKVSLGVVELAAALKFFSNAEYVQDLHVLPREVFFGIWIALFLALAVYLWGLVPRTKVGNGRRVGGLVSAWFAAYCLYGALGYPLDFVMNALAPAYGARDISRHELVVDDYEKAKALALQQGKLLLVNITGFTCANCRMVERGILPAEAIAPILEQHFVEARLHMDNEFVIEPTRWARQVKLRDELVQGRVTTPIYCSVDPKTGALLVEHVLKGGPRAWEQGYLDFLTRSLATAGRSLPTK